MVKENIMKQSAGPKICAEACVKAPQSVDVHLPTTLKVPKITLVKSVNCNLLFCRRRKNPQSKF